MKITRITTLNFVFWQPHIRKLWLCLTREPAPPPPEDSQLSWNWVSEHVCVWWCHPTGHNHGGNGFWAAPGAEEAKARGDASWGRTVRPIWLPFIQTSKIRTPGVLQSRKCQLVLHNGLICCWSHKGPAVQRGRCCCHLKFNHEDCVKLREQPEFWSEA